MENLKTHSEYADQPQGPQANPISFALPTGQVLDSHMIGGQYTNLSSFCFSLEQHRLQLDQVLQLHVSVYLPTILVLNFTLMFSNLCSLFHFFPLKNQNEQLQVSLQQQISMQNATLLNLVESVTRDALMQKHGEIASLQMELQKKQEVLETILHDRDEWMKVASATYEINQTLICMLHIMQQKANSHVSSNDLDAPSYIGEASSMARTAVGTTQPNLICKVCNSGNACMLVLPCQHLCACKQCVAWLAACPICGTVKTDAIEARFV